MLFSPKIKGFFVEQNENSWLLARTSASAPPLTVEDIKEVPAGNAEGLAAAIAELQPKKAPSGYLHSSVAFYSPKRVVRRTTLEPKRYKEPNYLSEVCVQQFRIEPDKYLLTTLNATDGLSFDVGRSTAKDVLFCGLPSDEVAAQQDALLQCGIYPERLEIGSIATLGGLVNYLNLTEAKNTTLLLEFGAESTHSYIVSANGIEASRPIPQGLAAMVPVVQKELGLKDEESARKLFYSNTFDFTGMGPLLIKRLLKELQSSIGFYEVQTGQSIGQVLSTLLPPNLTWLEGSVAAALGVGPLKLDMPAWLQSQHITLGGALATTAPDPRWFGLFSLIARYHQAEAAHAATAEKKA